MCCLLCVFTHDCAGHTCRFFCVLKGQRSDTGMWWWCQCILSRQQPQAPLLSLLSSAVWEGWWQVFLYPLWGIVSFPIPRGRKSHYRWLTGLVTPGEEIEWTNVDGFSISSIIVSVRSAMGGSAGRCPSPPTRLDDTEVHIPEMREKARDPKLSSHPFWQEVYMLAQWHGFSFITTERSDCLLQR